MQNKYKVVSTFFLVFILLLSVKASVSAATIRVPQNYSTISAAVNAAASGDTILVSPGNYSGNVTINKAVTVEGETYNQQNPAANQAKFTGLFLFKGANSQATVRGFWIQGSVVINSPALVEYNYITAGAADNDLINFEIGNKEGIVRGNILYKSTDDSIDIDDPSSNILIEDNRLLSSGQDGIEMRLQDSSAPSSPINVIVRNNEIIKSGQDGMQLIDYSQTLDTKRRVILDHNVIAFSGKAGLGLMANQLTSESYVAAHVIESVRVYNNTFYGNDYGISGGENLVAFNNIFANTRGIATYKIDGNSLVANTLFYGNGTDTTGSVLGTGNINGQNPQFSAVPSAGGDGQFGTVDDNFTGLMLQSNSPAIDRGVAQLTHRGELIPSSPITGYSGSAPDMGRYEFGGAGPTSTPTTRITTNPTNTVNPTPPQIGGDANRDGKVDGVDYLVWLTNYGQNVSGSSRGDFNSDGKVDGVDYIVWLTNYGKSISVTLTPTPRITTNTVTPTIS